MYKRMLSALAVIAGGAAVAMASAIVSINVNNQSGVGITGSFVNCGQGAVNGLSTSCTYNPAGPVTIRVNGYGVLSNASVYSCGVNVVITPQTATGVYTLRINDAAGACDVTGYIVDRSSP